MSRNSVTLDVSELDMSNSTTMAYMFYTCSNLKTIVVDRFNTPKVTTLSYAFVNCSNLTGVPNIDCSKVIIIANAFNSCSALTTLGELENLGKAYTNKTKNYTNYTLNLSAANKLTHDSLMNVINGLYDLNLTYKVASGGTLYTQTLNLGSTNKAKLTAEEIAIATNKGWTVS
jgi:surface protein